MRKPAAVLFVMSLAVLALALVPAAGLAAKGGNSAAGSGGAHGGGGSTTGGGGTIGLHVLTSPGDGLPHVMYKVTFDVSTAATSYPYVTLYCYRDTDNALVYKASNGIFPTSLGQVFTLGSNSWTTGSAHCTAYLQNWDNYTKHGTIQNLNSTSFAVYP